MVAQRFLLPRFNPTRYRTLAALILILSLTISAFECQHANAEDEFPQASPEDLGLRFPPDSDIVPGNDRLVTVPDDVFGSDTTTTIPAKDAVGKVYVEVGDHYAVLLPTGRLASVLKSRTTLTDRDFIPATKEQVLNRFRSSAFDKFKTKSTKRYVYVYNCNRDFVDGTSRILETMYPGLVSWCKNHGLRPKTPPFPMVVLIFATEEEFQKYRPMPNGVVAYYNTVTNHVVMYEQRKLAAAAPEIAFKQSVSTIAHEGAHQILHNIGVQDRLAKWPVWISEGLAEYFAPTELKGRARWKGVGHTNDLRLYELAKFYDEIGDARLTRGQLLRQTIESRTINSLGYAMAWSTVDYLVKRRRKAFTAYLQDVSKLGPLEAPIPGTLYTKHFGSDFVSAETTIGKHVATLPYKDPFENQVHYLATKWGGGNRETMVSASKVKISQFLAGSNPKKFAVGVFLNRTAAKQARARLKRD